jgi:CubicO group peptidase (beta-lactamase class C family)
MRKPNTSTPAAEAAGSAQVAKPADSTDDITQGGAAHNPLPQETYTQVQTRTFVFWLLAGKRPDELANYFHIFAKPLKPPFPQDSLLTLSTVKMGAGGKGVFTIENTNGKPPFHPIEINEATKYNTGSISKVLMMVMLMRLKQQGRFDLSLQLKELLPDAIKAMPQLAAITLYQLMSHTSGLRDARWGRYTRGEPLNEFVSVHEEPGSFYYANCNYTVLGYVIEAICGQPLESMLKELIVDPLGLNNTHYIESDIVPIDTAYGHVIQENTLPKKSDIFMFGAVCFRSSPSDIARILHEFFTNDAFIDKESRGIVTNSVQKRHFVVETPHAHFEWDCDAGLGIERYPTDKGFGYGHGGWTNGTAMFALHVPDSKETCCAAVSKAHRPQTS